MRDYQSSSRLWQHYSMNKLPDCNSGCFNMSLFPKWIKWNVSVSCCVVVSRLLWVGCIRLCLIIYRKAFQLFLFIICGIRVPQWIAKKSKFILNLRASYWLESWDMLWGVLQGNESANLFFVRVLQSCRVKINVCTQTWSEPHHNAKLHSVVVCNYLWRHPPAVASASGKWFSTVGPRVLQCSSLAAIRLFTWNHLYVFNFKLNKHNIT